MIHHVALASQTKKTRWRRDYSVRFDSSERGSTANETAMVPGSHDSFHS